MTNYAVFGSVNDEQFTWHVQAKSKWDAIAAVQAANPSAILWDSFEWSGR